MFVLNSILFWFVLFFIILLALYQGSFFAFFDYYSLALHRLLLSMQQHHVAEQH